MEEKYYKYRPAKFQLAMKRIIILSLMALFPLLAVAQDRGNSIPEQLSYKSQEIRRALFWEKDSETGRWISRPSKNAPWLGDGIHADNFKSIFIGEYRGYRYLFLDFLEGRYQYPTLGVDWGYYGKIYQALITDDDYESLRNIAQGGGVTITSRFHYSIFKNRADYSFPTLLGLTEVLRSVVKMEFEELAEKYGESFAVRNQEKDYLPIEIITAQRTVSSNADVVRFRIYPKASQWLMENSYFEVPYSEFQKLFAADKKTTYK